MVVLLKLFNIWHANINYIYFGNKELLSNKEKITEINIYMVAFLIYNSNHFEVSILKLTKRRYQ